MFSSTNVGIHDVQDVSVRYEEAGPEGRTKYARVQFHTAYGVVEVVAYVQGRDNLGVLNAVLGNSDGDCTVIDKESGTVCAHDASHVLSGEPHEFA